MEFVAECRSSYTLRYKIPMRLNKIGQKVKQINGLERLATIEKIATLETRSEDQEARSRRQYLEFMVRAI